MCQGHLNWGILSIGYAALKSVLKPMGGMQSIYIRTYIAIHKKIVCHTVHLTAYLIVAEQTPYICMYVVCMHCSINIMYVCIHVSYVMILL